MGRVIGGWEKEGKDKEEEGWEGKSGREGEEGKEEGRKREAWENHRKPCLLSQIFNFGGSCTCPHPQSGPDLACKFGHTVCSRTPYFIVMAYITIYNHA